jgi:hypothetical protein
MFSVCENMFQHVCVCHLWIIELRFKYQSHSITDIIYMWHVVRNIKIIDLLISHIKTDIIKLTPQCIHLAHVYTV